MIDYGVPLVLSGHIHTYERTHPLIKGYKYKIMHDNHTYFFNETEYSYLIQVVDGVAGSDRELFDEYTYEGKPY